MPFRLDKWTNFEKFPKFEEHIEKIDSQFNSIGLG